MQPDESVVPVTSSNPDESADLEESVDSDVVSNRIE